MCKVKYKVLKNYLKIFFNKIKNGVNFTIKSYFVFYYYIVVVSSIFVLSSSKLETLTVTIKSPKNFLL